MFAITIVNASADNGVIKYVKRLLLVWKNDDALVLGDEYIHVHCCAYILSLIVILGLS